jgi:hypothetical protein
MKPDIFHVDLKEPFTIKSYELVNLMPGCVQEIFNDPKTGVLRVLVRPKARRPDREVLVYKNVEVKHA